MKNHKSILDALDVALEKILSMEDDELKKILEQYKDDTISNILIEKNFIKWRNK